MTHDEEFTIDVIYEEQDLTVSGICEWTIENDSFDYAGTHCTGGRDGTHHLPDYCVAETCTIEIVTDEKDNDFSVTDPKILSNIETEVLMALQEEEDDNGTVMKHLAELAEQAEVDAQLDNMAEKDNYYG